MKTINEMLDKNYQSMEKLRELEEKLRSKRYWIISYLYAKVSHLIEEMENKIKEVHDLNYVKFYNNYELEFNVFEEGFFTSQRGESQDWQALLFINPETGGLMSRFHDIGRLKLTETFSYDQEKHPPLVDFLKQKEKEINELLKKELESECNEKIINDYINGIEG